MTVGAFYVYALKELVLEAKEVAQEEIDDYLKTLQTAHWATLRAAVRRGNTLQLVQPTAMGCAKPV
jgi:hypothetical protein